MRGGPSTTPSRTSPQGDMHPWPRFTLDVDGKSHTIDADPDMPLLYALETTSSSTIRISAAGWRNAAPAPCISTASRSAPASRRSQPSATARSSRMAGLGTPEKPHPIQAAYVEEQVTQCGYCINGWVMTAAALPQRQQEADRRRDQAGAAGLKCRCGTHVNILRAVKRAAEMMG